MIDKYEHKLRKKYKQNYWTSKIYLTGQTDGAGERNLRLAGSNIGLHYSHCFRQIQILILHKYKQKYNHKYRHKYKQDYWKQHSRPATTKLQATRNVYITFTASIFFNTNTDSNNTQTITKLFDEILTYRNAGNTKD